MAGIEATTQQIGPINPANLIGLASPVVEPRAVSALSDAFRQGVITADDITTRFGEVGKSADAAKVMAAKEAVSPEQQAARAAQTEQATVAAQQQTRRAQFPGTAAFDALAPGAGIDPPKNPDGTPDTAKENQIGTQLAAWDSTRKAARATVDSFKSHIGPTQQLTWYEQGGGPVSKDRKIALDQEANMTFQDYLKRFPGLSSSVLPGAGMVESETVVQRPDILFSGEVTPAMRGVVGQKYGSPTAMAMTDNDIRQQLDASGNLIVEARPPVTTAPRPEVSIGAASAPAPDQFSYQLPAPVTVEPKIKSTQEIDKAKLAMTRFVESNDMQSALTAAGFDPTSIGSWYNSILPQIIKSGDQKMYEAAKDAWAQGLLRLESGAAISSQEKSWYEKSFFPQVNDPPAVVASKEKLRHGTEQMVSDIVRIGAETPETKALADRLFQQASALGKLSGVSPKETTGATSNGVISLPGGGQAQRNAQGIYIRIK